MSESIYTLIQENQQVKEWLYRHSLSSKLNNNKASAEQMVRSETKGGISVDEELQDYCGDLAGVTTDLQTIQALRVKEQEAKEGLIGIIILAVVIFGLIIWAVV